MDLRTQKAIEQGICKDPYDYNNHELQSCTQNLLDQHELEKGTLLSPEEQLSEDERLALAEQQSLEHQPQNFVYDTSFCADPIVKERKRWDRSTADRFTESCWTRTRENEVKEMRCNDCCANGLASVNHNQEPCWTEADPDFHRCCSHPTREERTKYEEKQKQLPETAESQPVFVPPTTITPTTITQPTTPTQ